MKTLNAEESLAKEAFTKECFRDPTVRDRMSMLTRAFNSRKKVSQLYNYSVNFVFFIDSNMWTRRSFYIMMRSLLLNHWYVTTIIPCYQSCTCRKVRYGPTLKQKSPLCLSLMNPPGKVMLQLAELLACTYFVQLYSYSIL